MATEAERELKVGVENVGAPTKLNNITEWDTLFRTGGGDPSPRGSA